MTNEPLGVKRFLVQAVVDLELAADDEQAARAAASAAIRSTPINGARRLDHSIRTVEEYWRARLPGDT